MYNSHAHRIPCGTDTNTGSHGAIWGLRRTPIAKTTNSRTRLHVRGVCAERGFFFQRANLRHGTDVDRPGSNKHASVSRTRAGFFNRLSTQTPTNLRKFRLLANKIATSSPRWLTLSCSALHEPSEKKKQANAVRARSRLVTHAHLDHVSFGKLRGLSEHGDSHQHLSVQTASIQ